jgi:tetratricopeptide (TPR) repeat protein
MDLSGLKWPIIIAVVVGLGWLLTSGGVNWMVGNFTKATPGIDAQQDMVDEAGLSRVGGYLLFMWRWEKANDVLSLAVERYPEGPNLYYNLYRIARCEERMGNYQAAVDLMRELMDYDAHEIDERVPHTENLNLQANKLIEMYDLQ